MNRSRLITELGVYSQLLYVQIHTLLCLTSAYTHASCSMSMAFQELVALGKINVITSFPWITFPLTPLYKSEEINLFSW